MVVTSPVESRHECRALATNSRCLCLTPYRDGCTRDFARHCRIFFVFAEFTVKTRLSMFSRSFSLSLAWSVVSRLSLVPVAVGQVAPHTAAAATPSPTPSAVLRYQIGRLAADPLRPRVYATVPDRDSVIVIDTNSLK